MPLLDLISMDEETVYKICMMNAIFVGAGASPHSPPLGKRPSPAPTKFA